jgi:hypothetical protein
MGGRGGSEEALDADAVGISQKPLPRQDVRGGIYAAPAHLAGRCTDHGMTGHLAAELSMFSKGRRHACAVFCAGQQRSCHPSFQSERRCQARPWRLMAHRGADDNAATRVTWWPTRRIFIQRLAMIRGAIGRRAAVVRSSGGDTCTASTCPLSLHIYRLAASCKMLRRIRWALDRYTKLMSQCLYSRR